LVLFLLIDFRIIYLLTMKINKETILISIFLLPFFAGQIGCENLKSENERLKGEITDVNAENEKLKKELSVLRGENSKMHIHLAELNLQIATLHQEIQSLQKDVDSFKTQLKNSDKKKRGS
jgi:archaellum component FlaC